MPTGRATSLRNDCEDIEVMDSKGTSPQEIHHRLALAE